MKVKEGFILRHVGGKNVIVASGKAAGVFNGMITINDVGAFLWKKLEQDTTEEELVEALLETYDVEADKAKADVARFVSRIGESGFLE